MNPPAATACYCLRELAALGLPLASLAESSVVDSVRECCAHPHPAVASLATAIMDRWRTALITNLCYLTQPHVLEEPLQQLEERLQSPGFEFPPGAGG